jgi:MoaA/NifB/PqqE/SkfB family radical SAM enzyme
MLERIDNRAVIASRELTVENTTYCGASCVMCPRDEYKAERRWQHMPMELFKQVLKAGSELGITSLDLCGFGDPFMDPEFRHKLAHVRKNYPNLHIYTSTTGHLLDASRLDWVCTSLDTIKISNYGFSQASYEKIHGGGVKFEKVRENILALLARPRGERPYVVLSFLIFPENESEVEDWKTFWAPLADEIMVWRPHNFGGSRAGEDHAFLSSSRQDAEKVRSCGRPFKGNPFVRANGDVSVCCFDFNHRLVVGNVTEDSMLEVLQGARMADVQDIHNRLAMRESDLLCKGCDQIYDRKDALVYSNNCSREVDQPTTHPDHVVKLT